MHLASCLLTILALGLSLCGASPAPSRHVVHESRSSIPTGWSPVRRADQDIVLPLRIGLVQPNIHKVEEYLMEVSHPQSPGYGKHWTPAEVGHAFRPSKEAVDVVRSWLLMSALGADRIRMTNDGTWIRVNVTVKEAEKLLGTEYYVYEKETEGDVIACADKYHLPEHVSGHVELVTPTLQFDFKHKRRAAEKRDRPPPSKLWRGIPTSNVSPASSAVAQVNGPVENITEQLSACGEQITPACLQLLYNFTDFTPQVPGNNSIAIVELTPNAYLASDLDMFFANFSPSQVGERPIFVSIDGGVVQTTTESLDDNVESDLDLQYAMALVGPTQNVTLLQAGDLVEGDYGVATFGDCLDAAGDLGSGTDYTTFSPSFPATCPYVTGVGATQINTTSTRTMESAAYEPGKLSSGGGFSNIFALPSYQQTVVQDYLTNYPPPYSSSVYNSSGNSRAYPDLSANGVRYTVAADGEWLSVYGTSASTPVIASFFTAINDARIAAGKSSIGFINPTIYSSSFQAAFNDITDGSNPGCGTQGFYAEPGWDPVTGIGTPNVAMLRDLWLELQ
ncbi:hypothetical protein EVJ58_g6216 [Rhodofomes roseus]|uniref:Peptidase S53 domain-containing protein n=1 Tax=Rhodofomes roseus TaxID=34475 RepID=A0A4Y9YBB8_9APHY|nr:hypothetical protein EVJ58_g6216 [Rhodofomes roseus]